MECPYVTVTNLRLRPRFIGGRKTAEFAVLRQSRTHASGRGNCTMKSESYDIIRKENSHSAIWLEAARDLNRAESRIRQLSYCWPSEFQILDQRTHQIVDIIVSSPDRNWGRH
jgi:hypothetical protein